VENLSQSNKEEKRTESSFPYRCCYCLFLKDENKTKNKKRTQGIIRIGKGKRRKEKTPKKMQKMQNNRRASITTPCMVCPVRPAVVAALQNSTPS